ncbi:MAG: 2-phospho-L-lactate transferase CofD family protein, partial [Desulfobulbus sp.]|nr:2-phospho-L-lactate transferase CofD family protein [Desulfobulbus sp.]
MAGQHPLTAQLNHLTTPGFSVLDVIAENSLAEKITAIVLDSTATSFAPTITALFADLKKQVADLDTNTTRVVVFGGGTGLSNIVGGDSRRPEWSGRPFTGLKQLFPRVNSVVCITDDGGSTGELQKDLPLIALGDLRHVLISSIRRENLLREYGLDGEEAGRAAAALHAIFNYRFISPPQETSQLLSDTGARFADLPR